MAAEVALVIESALPGDEAAVTALWRACGLVTDYNDPVADFRFAKESFESDVLVGRDAAGAVIGSVMVGHDGHRGWLYYVAADPAVQGGGVGRAMVAAAEDWLRVRKVLKVQLLVRNTNQKIVGFYEKLGFETAQVSVLGKWLNR
jgi:ribosomal protein S18 acetylase RimI-like enzyme